MTDNSTVTRARLARASSPTDLNSDTVIYENGTTSGNDGDWYLRSNIDATDINYMRPEVGGYLANMSAASRLFNLRFEDREGRVENSSMWLRQVAARNESRDGTDQLRMATNTFITQLGGEMFQTQFSGTNHLGFGNLAGYTRANSDTKTKTSIYRTESKSTN